MRPLIIDTVSCRPLPMSPINYRYNIMNTLAHTFVTKINSRVLPAKPPSGGQREPDALPDTVSAKRRGFVSADTNGVYVDFIAEKRRDLARFTVVEPIRYNCPVREVSRPPKPPTRPKPTPNAVFCYSVSNESISQNTSSGRHRIWPSATVLRQRMRTMYRFL